MGDGYFGTEADSSDSVDYCKYCYQNGSFTEPDLTLIVMINRAVEQMHSSFDMPNETARELALAIIPHLKRWNS